MRESKNKIKQREGYAAKAPKEARIGSSDYGTYYDSAGNVTAGYGHLVPEKEYEANKEKWDNLSKKEAEKLFEKDYEIAKKAVTSLVKNDDLPEAALDPLISFVFNLGAGNFKTSTMLKKINKGDLEGAGNEFARWNKITVNNEKVADKGLTNRRKDEAEDFFKAIKSTPEIEEPDDTPVAERISRSMEEEQSLDEVDRAARWMDETGGTPAPEESTLEQGSPMDEELPDDSIFDRVSRARETVKPEFAPEKPAPKVPYDPMSKPTKSEELIKMRGEIEPPKTSTEDAKSKLESMPEETPIEEETYKEVIDEEDKPDKETPDDKINRLANVVMEHKEKIGNMIKSLEKSAGQLGKSDRDYFLEKYKILKEAYEENKKKIDQKKMLEGIAHGLAQMAAGWYGLKTGRDMSGVKFNKENWEAQYNRAMSEFRGDVSALDTEIGLDRAARRTARGDKEFALRTELSLMNQSQREIEDLRNAIAKADEKERKRIKKELRDKEKEFEKEIKKLRKRAEEKADRLEKAVNKSDEAGIIAALIDMGVPEEKARDIAGDGFLNWRDDKEDILGMAYKYPDLIEEAARGRPAAAPKEPEPTGWTPEDEKRMKELEAKLKAKGNK